MLLSLYRHDLFTLHSNPLHRHRSVLLLAILLALSCSTATASAAEWLTVRGKLVPVSDADETVEKSFTLQVLVSEADDQNELIWTLEEAGAGSWSWLDHVGRLAWDERGTLAADSFSPALRYESGEVYGTVPLSLVLPQPAEALAIGTTWEHSGLTYAVTESARIEQRTAWLVSVRNNFGEKRTMLATMPSGLIADVQETVFLGQGGRYRLSYQVAERRPMADEAWQQARNDYDALQQLREQAEWRAHELDRAWTDEQRTALKDALPALRQQTETEPLANFLRVAFEESRLERGRAGALEAMRRRALDSALPDFQLEPLGSRPLRRPDLDDGITILHFWDYRDAPLREPYGQVGYLDFLSRKYESQGVRVVGVVIASDPDAPQELRQSAASARRFANFMNLAYPLYVDQGGLLGKVGDPRLCDAALPLFVAVGRDGKILHYHAGHYPVDNNRGLVELETVIQSALQKGE
jgi:hypothetical protein